MMRNTPRAFVGPAVFELERATCRRIGADVSDQIGRVPGITRCELDRATGLLLVTAESPVDRADVLDLLSQMGVRLRT
jgi:hypothetical protein